MKKIYILGIIVVLLTIGYAVGMFLHTSDDQDNITSKKTERNNDIEVIAEESEGALFELQLSEESIFKSLNMNLDDWGVLEDHNIYLKWEIKEDIISKFGSENLRVRFGMGVVSMGKDKGSGGQIGSALASQGTIDSDEILENLKYSNNLSARYQYYVTANIHYVPLEGTYLGCNPETSSAEDGCAPMYTAEESLKVQLVDLYPEFISEKFSISPVVPDSIESQPKLRINGPETVLVNQESAWQVKIYNSRDTTPLECTVFLEEYPDKDSIKKHPSIAQKLHYTKTEYASNQAHIFSFTPTKTSSDRSSYFMRCRSNMSDGGASISARHYFRAE